MGWPIKRISKAEARKMYPDKPEAPLEEDRVRWFKQVATILTPACMNVVIVLGIRLESQGRWSKNWRAGYGRSQQLRKRTAKALAKQLTPSTVTEVLDGHPTHITFTRCAPRRLDDDNLRTAFKPIRDQLVAWLAGYTETNVTANDGMRSGYTFDYKQQQQRAYGVQIELRP